jgi:hypothetical protein
MRSRGEMFSAAMSSPVYGSIFEMRPVVKWNTCHQFPLQIFSAHCNEYHYSYLHEVTVNAHCSYMKFRIHCGTQ